MQWNRKVFLAEIRWLKATEGVKTVSREYSNAVHKTVRMLFQSCVPRDRSPDTVMHMIIPFHSEGKSHNNIVLSSDVGYTVTKRFRHQLKYTFDRVKHVLHSFIHSFFPYLSYLEDKKWEVCVCWANRVELRTVSTFFYRLNETKK